MKTDILIVGGGLAGLALARHLYAAGRDFYLVEARDRVGGRILTETVDEGYFDLGPAWFWPGQPRIASLIEQLGLTRFEQHYEGILTYENEHGQVQRGSGHASMQGSWRLEGGLGRLTDKLAADLPQSAITLTATLKSLRKTDTIHANLSNDMSITANQVVLAIPPRIAAASITFDPALPPATMDRMTSVSTWMAGQAKALAVYETPFWRNAGLSGDAMSRQGPMVEIHDASPAAGGPYGLFGFIGVPPHSRTDEAVLRSHLINQLVRLFGSEAAKPTKLFVKDWALDRLTATAQDAEPIYAHPHYGLPRELEGLWSGALHFGGTEVATEFGGFAEGALEAAENVLKRVMNS